ncbi:MAG: hypothetical protein A2655_00730 [Candidatus Yanofskybacteria bacterium RIFCSPHIGHO2_01_FULL_43_42]|uniref:Uncharacterized protein n=1 Tax=Candidatus Yanofskybacteria bacterium RIFCSPLOWO2_01_FULL_43_22 TaxID=1802695 RepID=A0A1F8GJE2_9BACT|nr:MAG: hypothetical protein A2655_00730 [Candidatus Yanofskybacteria bacterium RIFCSPHIGHO2_01_FULL_43_42]OGN13435.1 MAG: hypothetical protein A3D48_01055 [Candidatus Yanofskybacteria bacterium RIFCSPHIGHO2_02_FULL_43_17]OGN24806.1 MAG: hypothetical protein A3A13_04695 [Candidatus Yanofskybacteria bacterium RIFCSPLOWO2_01_FULL_43_22]
MKIFSNDYFTSLPNSALHVKGGPARFTIEFSAFIVSHGHSWTGLLHGPGGAEPLEELLRVDTGRSFFKISSQSATQEALRKVSEGVAPEVFFAKDIETVAELMRQDSPDIVLINGFSSFAWILSAAARRNDLPFVIQHAGIWKREVDAYGDLFSPGGRAMCYAMEKEAAETASTNIFLNEYSREVFQNTVRPDVMRGSIIIPLPHSGWPFTGNFIPQKRDARILGVVARWDRIKNQGAILAVAEEVNRQRLPWRIRSVTEIPDTPVQADFKARYRELIDILPHMKREALREFYGSVDMMILPSHFDVSPTVVMEAVSVGIPTLISPNVGWVSEYMECGMGDWIVPFDNPGNVIRRIRELFLRTAWPEASQFAEHIKKRHEPFTVFSYYLDLFEQIIKMS